MRKAINYFATLGIFLLFHSQDVLASGTEAPPQAPSPCAVCTKSIAQSYTPTKHLFDLNAGMYILDCVVSCTNKAPDQNSQPENTSR